MTTIYLVTTGEYSSYEVVGAFSTCQMAHQYIAELEKLGRFYGGQVEEFEIDRLARDQVTMVFSTVIELATGALKESGVRKELYGPDSNYPASRHHRTHCSRSSKSQEHANKLAVEARQEWLRKYGTKPCQTTS